jgi:hypothetical protein
VDRPDACGIAGRSHGYVDPAGPEKRNDPVLTAPVVHVAAVVLHHVKGVHRFDDDHTRIGQYLVEQMLPCFRVQRGGVGDDSVHVEDDLVVRRLDR